jgi:protein-L-isoaspartate(D-aspartate) O-methyltransferase
MDEVDKAFRAVPRAKFVLPEYENQVDRDAPLPIGFGQTISQPTTVQMMLKWLEVEPGNKILDVGSGSGWTTALLAYLTGPKGRVYAVELIPELVEFGRQNCKKLGIKDVEFHQAGKQYGLPHLGPYDRILVSAAAQVLPQELLGQLKPGGPSTGSGRAKLVIPVKNDILEIEKLPDGQIETLTHPGFVFVPLLKNSN